MKKIVFLLLSALLLTSAAQARDSTWLQSESVMTAKVGRSSSIIPLGTIIAWPHGGNMPSSLSTDDWCECDGRAIPSNSDIVRKLGITRTPNLYAGQGAGGRGYFLRAGATPQQVSKDKFESHLHGQPPHTHSWKGQLVSTALTSHLESSKVQGKLDNAAVSGQLVNGAVSGTAAGQQVGIPNHTHENSYFDNWNGHTNGWAWMPNHPNTGPAQISGGTYATVTASSSSVTANVNNRQVTSTVTNTSVSSNVVNTLSRGNVTNGTVSGTNALSGGDDTYETGEEETAPTYYTTRYFMRINQ